MTKPEEIGGKYFGCALEKIVVKNVVKWNILLDP